MSFIAQRPLPGASASLPFCVRFQIRLRAEPFYALCHLDTGTLAKSAQREISPTLVNRQTELASPRVQRFLSWALRGRRALVEKEINKLINCMKCSRVNRFVGTKIVVDDPRA